MVDKKLDSILRELENYVPEQNKNLFIESKAKQVIAAANHVLKLINETYSAEDSEELTKRLLNSIRANDETKFCRKIRKMGK